MANQNRISYGFAPPGTTERGYGPKKRLQFNSTASPDAPLQFQQIVQLTVDARTFGTEFSNNFQRHDVGHMQIDKSSTENLRLWQLMVKVAYDSKEQFNAGASKKEKKEPKIIGFRGQLEDHDFFVNEQSSIYNQFSSLAAAEVETWAAEHDYRIVNQETYVETWEGFTEEDAAGEGRVFSFIESIPKNYEIEELQHAAAYRIWIIFESGCGMDLNAQVRDVITPPENRKKKDPIKHFDQYRMINNNESFRQHVSNNLFRDDDAIKATISMPLTEEGNKICPTHILNPKACFNNTINHLFRDGTRKNIIPVLFPSSQPDPKGFMAENYLNGNKFIVAEDQRKHMIELTSRDLNPENFMKKYKPDVWLHYILPRQLSSVMQKHAKLTESVRDATYNVDEISSKLDEWNIDITKNYQFNGHGYKDIWADNENHCEGRAGKEWAEGNHDVMRVRTITHHEEVPRFNDEMKTANNAMQRYHVFMKYFKKSLQSFSRVIVPEAIVDNATFSLINYPNELRDLNYSTTIEPAWKFTASTMQFFDLFLSKMAANLEYVRFVATQHFKIIQMWLGSGCSKSLIQEKTHYTLQGPGQSGKSNAMNRVKEMKTPGTVQELTHSSTLATLDMDCFNTIVQEHEQNPNAVGQGGKMRNNDQLKTAEIRKNMKTNGENSTTRLERKGKDSPMQTIVQNSIHSKVFMGCTNRKLSERDEASRSRDCELILPKISRIGKTITSCRNAESSQSHETKQAGLRFLYLCRMFDVWEHRIRAGQDQPLLIPEVSTLVWTDVLGHMQEYLKKVTDTGNMVRAKGRMTNTLTTVIIMEAFCILFLFEPPKKQCVFYINDERISEGELYDALLDKEVTESGLPAEKEVMLFEDAEGNATSVEANGNGSDPKAYAINFVKGIVNPQRQNTIDRSREVASFRVAWEFEDEYQEQKNYDVGDVVKFRYENIIWTLRCARQPSVDPLPGNFWQEVEERLLSEPWDPKRRYRKDEIVQHGGLHFECQSDCSGVDPLRNTAWACEGTEMESLLGKYYEQNYDLQDAVMQYDISSLLYCTIPNAITTCGMNQDEILPQGLSKFIKQLCKFAKEKLMEVEDAEAKRYNHCMPNNRDGVTASKNQVEIDYICLGEDYESGITKLLQTNFTPGYIVEVDKTFIDDSFAEVQKQKTQHVKKLPDTVRIKKRFFRIQNTMQGIRETECSAQDAMREGKLKDGYSEKEEWQHWKTTVDADGNFNGGWKEFDMEEIRIDYDRPEKRKIQIKRVGSQWRYYVYVPWVYEVTRSQERDPFVDALSSYKFKSNDADERMEILLGTPYEGLVTTSSGETKTCIPWVSNKVVLEPSLERKIIYKSGQVIPEAADIINMHRSQCEVPEEEVLTDHFDQYANLHHQKTKMMNPQLQDVLLDKAFAEHFKYCCKYTLLKEAHAMQAAKGGYKMQNFPRQLADQGYKDQINHQKRKKRSANEVVPSNPRSVVPRIFPVNFSNIQ
jgi:hypothetical protein